MAVLSKSEFITKWTARFADNTTGQITESDLREFATDIKDSFGIQSDLTTLQTLLGTAPLNTTAQTIREAINELAKSTLPMVTYTGSITLALTDVGKKVNMASVSACTVTVPNDSAVNIPLWTQIVIRWGNAAGQPTIVAGSGVTIESAGNRYKLAEQKGEAVLHKIGANHYTFAGGTAA